ncbi:MAG: 3-hydroxyacyl-ACP dehydratase FabZ [Acinetobacter sp.]|nr:3-hydroxyacyl-ACP dehydratase FabZ [Acinetobacter sp.]
MSENQATPSYTVPKLPLVAQDIHEYLPHRYPFLLVDRVVAVEGNAIVGYKNVSINEEFFQGHFPQQPIMPGVLIVEALAQVSGILGFIMNNVRPDGNSLFLFAGAEKVRFKRPVVPGDQLVLKSELVMQRRGIYKYNCTACVDDQVVATAEITISHQKLSNNE